MDLFEKRMPERNIKPQIHTRHTHNGQIAKKKCAFES